MAGLRVRDCWTGAPSKESNMSFDLGVFYTARTHTDAEAVARCVAYCEQDELDSLIEPSPAIAAFLKELTDAFPQIDEWPEESVDDCPWSCSFDRSDGHVIMAMKWSVANELPIKIVALAAKHGLVCVDPQSEKIIAAPWMRSPSRPWWKFWK